MQPGDTLEGIAARFGTTVADLAAANGITDANLIRVGQRLAFRCEGARKPEASLMYMEQRGLSKTSEPPLEVGDGDRACSC